VKPLFHLAQVSVNQTEPMAIRASTTSSTGLVASIWWVQVARRRGLGRLEVGEDARPLARGRSKVVRRAGSAVHLDIPPAGNQSRGSHVIATCDASQPSP
jgi:hypothetical protein